MRSPDQVAAMQCPVCHVPLAMSDRQGIEIDYCPQCRGIWLDCGELDKIIERSAAPAQPAAQPAAHPAPPPQQPWGGQPQQHYGHGYDPRYKQKRRKSFLEELFD